MPVPYRCEICSLTLKEDHKTNVFRNSSVNQKFDLRETDTEDLSDLYSHTVLMGWTCSSKTDIINTQLAEFWWGRRLRTAAIWKNEENVEE
jgi:hypothetical protein